MRERGNQNWVGRISSKISMLSQFRDKEGGRGGIKNRKKI